MHLRPPRPASYLVKVLKVQMMGLYQLKEFLTLDDVADYLRDKGVYDFDLYSDYDRSRLESWLVPVQYSQTPHKRLYYPKLGVISHDKTS